MVTARTVKKLPIKNSWAAKVHDLILGGQDGLVNVLGVVLGVAAATMSTRVVLIAGLAATFAESISMGAVAYTSAKAAKEYSLSIGKKPPQEYADPIASGVTVGIASLAGSFIPLLPFFLLSVGNAIVWSIAVCTLALFIAGAAKAKLTIGTWWKSGIELAIIGMLAAFAGYAIGYLMGATI